MILFQDSYILTLKRMTFLIFQLKHYPLSTNNFCIHKGQVNKLVRSILLNP